MISKSRIQVTIKDSDFGAADDVLGYCSVDWKSCVENPGKWAVNEVFQLDGDPSLKQ